MAKHRVNQLPVLDNDHLVGIVTDRDIRDAYPTSMMINRGKEIDRLADKITVEEVMTHDFFIVRPIPRWRRPSDYCGAIGSAHCPWSNKRRCRHHYAQRYPRFCPERRREHARAETEKKPIQKSRGEEVQEQAQIDEYRYSRGNERHAIFRYRQPDRSPRSR